MDEEKMTKSFVIAMRNSISELDIQQTIENTPDGEIFEKEIEVNGVKQQIKYSLKEKVVAKVFRGQDIEEEMKIKLNNGETIDKIEDKKESTPIKSQGSNTPKQNKVVAGLKRVFGSF